MAMVCTQCHAAFEQRLHCPSCNVRLVFQERAAGARLPFSLRGWQHTAWGRILIGLVLAQGLFFGLVQLGSAANLAFEWEDAETLRTTWTGLCVLEGLQVFALLIGGILAGAAQRQGALYGMFLGLWSGVLFLILHPTETQLLGESAAFGQPLLSAFVGIVAGWLGRVIWTPLPLPAVQEASQKMLKVAPRPRRNPFAGPIFWPRALIGTAVAVAGYLGAGSILEALLTASAGQLDYSTHFQGHLLTWEISGLALLTGSALAGATTANGFKQGLAVACMATVVLLGVILNQAPSPEVFLLTATSPMMLCTLGGGFGGQLIPPISSARRRLVDGSA